MRHPKIVLAVLVSFTVLKQSAITCSKLTTETLEQGVKYFFIVNFEHISHLVNSEQVNAICWSSRSKVFCKMLLRNFARFIEKKR